MSTVADRIWSAISERRLSFIVSSLLDKPIQSLDRLQAFCRGIARESNREGLFELSDIIVTEWRESKADAAN